MVSNFIPTLAEIQTAFLTALQVALADDVAAKKVVLIPPMEDFAPELNKIAVLSTLKTDAVRGVELGGPGAVGVRSGLFLVTLSVPQGTALNICWDLAQKLERYFAYYSYAALQAGSESAVYCDMPYTMNAGKTPDKRLALVVYVPWHTWASN